MFAGGSASSNTNATDESVDPLLLGVSIEAVKSLVQLATPGAATREVGEAVRAQDAATSFAQRMLLTHGSSHAGRATVFVSHAQSVEFEQLCSALELHSRETERAYYWLDIASIGADVVGGVSKIGEVVRTIQQVLLVIDPWHAPVCLTRVWWCARTCCP